MDNLQRFRIFHAAMRLVTKSAKSADDNERRQEPSEKMELLLKDMTSVIWRVVRNAMRSDFKLTENIKVSILN